MMKKYDELEANLIHDFLILVRDPTGVYYGEMAPVLAKMAYARAAPLERWLSTDVEFHGNTLTRMLAIFDSRGFQ